MPRVSKGPRYYPTKSGWFANFDGERVRLTTGTKKATEEAAKERYQAEKAARSVQVEGDRSTVWSVLVAFLSHCENRVTTGDLAPATYEMRKSVLTSFSQVHGNKPVRGLRPQHVTDWLAQMREPRWNEALRRTTQWGDATETLGRNVLRTALLWAKDEAGLITSHPFDRAGGKVKKQKRRRRRPTERRLAITDGEHTLLLEQARRRSHPDFYHLMLFWYHTGARPAEMYGAKANEWDEAKKAFVIRATPENHGRYKLAHLGENRVLYIPNELVPRARELMVRYPDGPIFRTEAGTTWTNETVCARMTSIKRAANRAAEAKGVAGVRKGLTSYSWRHAFVTRWVKQGKPLTILCELLNTSESMLREHYSHLFEETEVIREALDAFSVGGGGLPRTESASGTSSSRGEGKGVR